MGGFIINFNKNNEPINEESFIKRKQVESLSFSNENISLKKYKKLLFDHDPFCFENDNDL